LKVLERENTEIERIVEEVKKEYKKRKKSLRYNKKMMQSKINILHYHNTLLEDEMISNQ
jgi:hypothetical protein